MSAKKEMQTAIPSTEKKPAVLRLWGCGGAGINIASRYIDSKPEEGCAIIKPAFLDTSDSNLSQMDYPDKYLIPGVNGSGAVRGTNAEAISKSIKNILASISPGDVNVIISSGSGGSGAIFSALLTGELLDMNQKVFVILIGSTESRIRIENTVKSLSNLELIAEDTQQPVNLHYLQNVESRSKVDKDAIAAIAAFSLVTSNMHLGLDPEDIHNFLRHHRFTGASPRLTLLDIIVQTDKSDVTEKLASYDAPYSILSLYNNQDDVRTNIPADYDTQGFCNLASKSLSELHLMTYDGIADIYKQLSDLNQQTAKARDSVVVRESIVAPNAKSGKRLVL